MGIHTQNKKEQSGFSILEMMITLAAAAILISIAIPSMAGFLQQTRIKSSANQLYVSLSTARSEAIKKRTAVRLCPRSTHLSCSNDGIWENGWIIFQDANGSGQPDPGEVLNVTDPLEPGVMVIANSSSGGDFIQFNASGDAMQSWGYFRVCHTKSKVDARRVGVSLGGRVQESKLTSSSCKRG